MLFKFFAKKGKRIFRHVDLKMFSEEGEALSEPFATDDRVVNTKLQVEIASYHKIICLFKALDDLGSREPLTLSPMSCEMPPQPWADGEKVRDWCIQILDDP